MQRLPTQAFLETGAMCIAQCHLRGVPATLLVVTLETPESLDEATLKAWNSMLRPGDLVGTLKDRAFGIVMAGVDLARATEMAQRLRLSLQNVEATGRIGAVAFAELQPAESLEQAIARAAPAQIEAPRPSPGATWVRVGQRLVAVKAW